MKLIEFIRKAWKRLLHGRDRGVEVVRLPDGRSYVRVTHSFVATADLLPFGENVEVEKLHTPTVGTDKAQYRHYDGEWR